MLFTALGQMIPQPLAATGYQMAYVISAGLVWLLSNTLLFTFGLRNL